MIFSRPWLVEAEHGEILHVFRQQERARLKYEDALAAVAAAKPEVFSQGCAERSTSNDDEVEWPEVPASGQTGSGTGIRVNGDEHFVKGIAYVASEHIAGKRSVLGGKRRGRHGFSPLRI